MILAVDPGTTQSAYVLFEGEDAEKPLRGFGIVENPRILKLMDDYKWKTAHFAVEMIASYGMPVGADVFETCTWIGRFEERWGELCRSRVFRKDVKMHLCQSMRAKDGNIRQALIDRYGPGKAAAVGRKATPGPLYGVSKDVWAALGVAVTWWDLQNAAQETKEAMNQ